MRRVIIGVLTAGMMTGQAPQRQTLEPSEGMPPKNVRLEDGSYVLRAGTRIPLTLLNSVGTKNGAPGDQLYLQTIFPVAVAGRILVPVGTYVQGTVTDAKRPGRVKGRGELGLRFDTLTYPSGTTVELAGRIGSLAAESGGELKREEGTVKSDGAVGKDAAVVAGTALGGAAMGRWVGDSSKWGGIGAGAGSAAGLAAILLSRGPEVMLQKGATLDLVLTRDVRLTDADLR